MSNISLDPAVKEFLLQSIRTRSTEDIEKILRLMNISLGEMLNAGLASSQLNEIDFQIIESQLLAKKVEMIQLEKGGLLASKLEQLGGSFFSPPPIPTTEFIAPPPPIPQEDIVKKIIAGTAMLEKVRDELRSNRLSDSKLMELGYSMEVVQRIREFESQDAYVPALIDLPPLRKNATDIYFLGMPGSGKSTMLASLLAYCNKKGLIRPVSGNSHGNKYRTQLITGMSLGFLPDSTPEELVNFIPIDLRNNERSEAYHKLNFIDIAGEKFKRVAASGIESFKAYKDYLKSDNRKCLVFILDYHPADRIADIMQQDQNLQEVISYLTEFEIMETTDMIYLVVTKADRFPSEDKQAFADRYIDENYPVLLAACLDAKKMYNLEVKSFPYSIGPTDFKYILRETDWQRNRNLEVYPSLLANQLFEDSAMDSKGWRLFGK